MATTYYGDPHVDEEGGHQKGSGEGVVGSSSDPMNEVTGGSGAKRKRWINQRKFGVPRRDRRGGASNGAGEGLLAVDAMEEDELEIYVVKQKYGYCSILFSIAQTVVLVTMMVQCGVAPLNINPMIGPYPDALSDWGAKNSVNILEDGEWWRLITPIMLHAGIIHLGCNLLVQLETGAFFEREWGSLSWLAIYLVSAVGSTALSVVAMPDAISVGSSGAVMGLFGGKGAEVLCRCCETSHSEQDKVGHQVRKEQCMGVMCSVTIVLLFSFIPYVDWAAHLGGLLAGFCVGMILFAVDLKKAICSKLLWLCVGVAITGAYFVVVFRIMYSGDVQPSEALRDVCGYYQQNFEDYQCNCMREEQK
jgi:membrane associated rhomboid family serine protease